MTATLVWSIIGAVLLGLLTLPFVVMLIIILIAGFTGDFDDASVLVAIPVLILGTFLGGGCAGCAINAYNAKQEMDIREVYEPQEYVLDMKILSYYDNYLPDYFDGVREEKFTLIKVGTEYRIYLNEDNYSEISAMKFSNDAGISFGSEKLNDDRERTFALIDCKKTEIHFGEKEDFRMAITKIEGERKFSFDLYAISENDILVKVL